MHAAALVVLALAAATAPPAVERALPAGSGRLAVRLDRDVYEFARADLGDLRVIDERGALVPFLLDRGEREARRLDLRPELRNEARLADGSATAVLDFGGRVRKSRLRLELPGDNFRRRVRVEASDDGASWSTVVDEAWVFAVPGPEAARYETLALAENDFPLLRVTVHPAEGERGGPSRLRVLGAVVPASLEPPRREAVLHPQWTRAEEPRGRETWLTLDLGARHQPFHALELETDEPRFFREVRLEARREPAPGAQGLAWVELGRGAVHRLEHGGRTRECLRLDVAGRERVLRLRVRNGDDRPLAVRAVALHEPIERVVFESAPGHAYRLVYGSTAPAPAFDLERTVGDPAAWAVAATEVAPGAARRASPAAPEAVPWTERHGAVLWGGLVAVVAALGAITWRALRDAGRSS